MTAIDIEQIRSDTPGTTHVAHLLACGSSLMPAAVVDAIADHHQLEARIGGYEAHADRFDSLEAVYGSVAKLINAEPREIALVENATVAWAHAFYALEFEPGDRILTCEAEYAANYVAYLQRAKRDGIAIEVIPSDSAGAIDLDAMRSMIERDADHPVKLVSITWIPTNGGLVNPAAEVGAIAKEHGITYLVDACQAVGQMPVDVEELQCDFLSATGRKFLRGPRGTGFLYVCESFLDAGIEPAIIDHYGADWVADDRYQLRDDARRFETWENSYALRAGLGAAVDYALDVGLEAIQDRAWDLAASLRKKLGELPGVTLYDLGHQKCSIVTFTLDGHEPSAVVAALREQGIHIGASDPESTRLDSTARSLPTMNRAAPHYFNTGEEVDRLVDALSALASASTH